jgi:hypothetical protein
MVDVPPEWNRGALLDLRRYEGGQFIATLMGEEPNDERSNIVTFASAHDAQAFVSDWYDKPHGR